MRDARDHGVGVACLDHKPGVEQRFRCEAAGHFGIRVGAPFAVQGRVRVQPMTRFGIEDENRFREPLVVQTPRRRGHALVTGFRKYDAQSAAADLLEAAFEDAHRIRTFDAVIRSPAMLRQRWVGRRRGLGSWR